jgi:hypothetical protein
MARPPRVIKNADSYATQLLRQVQQLEEWREAMYGEDDPDVSDRPRLGCKIA